MKFRLRNIIEIIIWAERLAGVIVSSQFGRTVRLCIRVILACYVIRYKINNYFQTCAMCAMYQILKFFHTSLHVVSQVRIYIIIILDSIGRTRFSFYNSRMIWSDVITAIVRLSGMFDDACIPYMRSTQFLDFTKCFESEISHFPTTIGGNVSIVDTVVVVISKQAGEYLVDNYFIFVIHIE